MAIDLRALVDPSHTALVTQECQRGVIGDLSQLPELAAEAQRALPQMAALVRAACVAQVPLIHCTAERRGERGLPGRAATRRGRRLPAELRGGGIR